MHQLVRGFRQRKRLAGFGLPDLLISIALFSIAIVSLLSVFTLSAHAVQHSQENVAAQNLAERLLEEQRGLPFANVASKTGTHKALTTNRGSDVFIEFTYNVQVTSLPNTTNPNLKDVAVRVDWFGDSVGSDPVARSVTLETAVYK